MGKDVLYEFHGFKFSWDWTKLKRTSGNTTGIPFEIAAQAVVNDVQAERNSTKRVSRDSGSSPSLSRNT